MDASRFGVEYPFVLSVSAAIDGMKGRESCEGFTHNLWGMMDTGSHFELQWHGLYEEDFAIMVENSKVEAIAEGSIRISSPKTEICLQWHPEGWFEVTSLKGFAVKGSKE